MFKVYIDYDKMYDICLEQDVSDMWYKILCKQQGININHSVDDDEFYDENNPLLVFSQMNGIVFNDESSYMNDIPNNNSRVLEQPCGFFVIPIDSTLANSIQSDYGVICRSSMDKVASVPLTIDDIDVDGPNANGSTWGRFPFGLLGVPTNTIIIQDRYFFKSDNGESINDTYENFTSILSTLLPRTFHGTFHVMIIVDASGDGINRRDNVTFENIVDELEIRKNALVAQFGYTILLEVLSVPSGSYKYEKTHNRRIITNYYMIKADHKLKAFRGQTPLADQTLTSKFLYSKGLDGLSDPPVNKHTSWIQNFRDIVTQSKRSLPGYYLYSCDGNHGLSTNDIKNRILI